MTAQRVSSRTLATNRLPHRPEAETASSAGAKSDHTSGPRGEAETPELPPLALERIVRGINRSDLPSAACVARAWRRPAGEAVAERVIEKEIEALKRSPGFRRNPGREALVGQGWAKQLETLLETLRRPRSGELARVLSAEQVNTVLDTLGSSRFVYGEVAVARLVAAIARRLPDALESKSVWGCVRAEWEPMTWPILESAGVPEEERKIVQDTYRRAMAFNTWAGFQKALGNVKVFGRSILPPRTLGSSPAHWISSTIHEGHEAWIEGASVLPDDRFLTFGHDGTIRLWTETEERNRWSSVPLEPESPESLYVMSAAVLSDGRLVTGACGQARVWQEREGGWQASALDLGERTWAAHAIPLAEGGFILGAFDGSGWRWRQTEDGAWASERLADVADQGHHVFTQPMPRGGFLTGTHQVGQVWEQADGEWRFSGLHTADGESREGAAVLPDGRRVSAEEGAPARPWAEERDALANRWKQAISSWSRFKGTVLPDGSIITGARDPIARLYQRSSTGWACRTFSGHEAFVSDVKSLTDGRLVTVSSDKTVRVWSPPR